MSMYDYQGHPEVQDANKYLSSTDYEPKGNIMKWDDGTEMYTSGNPLSRYGIILLADYYGWDSGRIRNICDFFGDSGYFSVIPRLSSKTVESKEVKDPSESAGMLDWYKSRTFDGNVKPAVASMLEFMKKQGCDKKYFLIGFSWGGWAAAHVLGSDISDEFTCAALVHPTLELEGTTYSGTVSHLMSRIDRPFLLFADQSDPAGYASFMKMLKFKFPSSDVVEYPDSGNQFLLHGNETDENVRSACTKALTEIFGYFGWHASMDPQYLVRETEPMDMHRYLSITEYSQTGNIITLNDGTLVYTSGNQVSKNGVIILPDYYGWDSGRIRNLCDFFGEQGFFAVIPRFSSKEVETKEVKGFYESSGLLDWYKSRTFDGYVKPAITSVVDFMRQQVVERICLLGFSWGGWAALNLIASGISDDFTCAALVHPNFELEETMYGGSLPDLMCRVNRPFLLIPVGLPSRDEGESTSFEAYVNLLKYKLPTSELMEYHNLDKQFLLHGDDTIPLIRKACLKSLKEIFVFFELHCSMNPRSLVRPIVTLGPQTERTGRDIHAAALSVPMSGQTKTFATTKVNDPAPIVSRTTTVPLL